MRSYQIGRHIILLILTAVAVLTLVACKPTSGPTGEDTITFTDALGREVSVGKHPERVAALLGSFADVWMLAGGDVCAAPEDAWEDFSLELDGAVNIGGAHSPGC